MFVCSIEASSLLTNGRPKSGSLWRTAGPPYSQTHSQSSSEFGLSLARTDSGGRTDISETSTTDDYITANTSTGTGTTGTGTSATTSSWTRPPHLPSSAAPSAASATATAADGSSFESASSIYSLARSEVSLSLLLSIPSYRVPILIEVIFQSRDFIIIIHYIELIFSPYFREDNKNFSKI